MPVSAAPPSDARAGRGPIAALRARLSGLAREVIKFGTVGGLAFVLDTGLFNLLVHAPGTSVLSAKPVTAAVVSTCVATLFAWVGNRYWTYRHRRRSALRREAVLFFAVNGLGIAIALGCLAVSRYVLGLDGVVADNIAKNVIGVALGMVFRFTAYRYVVFRGDREAVQAVSETDLMGATAAAPVDGHGTPVGDGAPRPGEDALAGPAPVQEPPGRTWTTSPALRDTGPRPATSTTN